jgi:hypothetical protein
MHKDFLIVYKKYFVSTSNTTNPLNNKLTSTDVDVWISDNSLRKSVAIRARACLRDKDGSRGMFGSLDFKDPESALARYQKRDVDEVTLGLMRELDLNWRWGPVRESYERAYPRNESTYQGECDLTWYYWALTCLEEQMAYQPAPELFKEETLVLNLVQCRFHQGYPEWWQLYGPDDQGTLPGEKRMELWEKLAEPTDGRISSFVLGPKVIHALGRKSLFQKCERSIQMAYRDAEREIPKVIQEVVQTLQNTPHYDCIRATTRESERPWKQAFLGNHTIIFSMLQKFSVTCDGPCVPGKDYFPRLALYIMAQVAKRLVASFNDKILPVVACDQFPSVSLKNYLGSKGYPLLVTMLLRRDQPVNDSRAFLAEFRQAFFSMLDGGVPEILNPDVIALPDVKDCAHNFPQR